MLKLRVFAAASCVLVMMTGCAPKEEAAPPEPEPVAEAPAPEPEPMLASAMLQPKADGMVSGSVVFTQVGGTVAVAIKVADAPPGTHGFHIHELGDCSSDDFKSAGGHFNPADVPHGGPDDAERHAGDLGNIEIGEDGTGRLEISSDLITVEDGPTSVVGRGVILHADADDLVSQPTGAAGARLACGVIALGEPSMAAEEAAEAEG